MQPHLTRPRKSFAFTFSIHLLRLIFPFCRWFPFWDGGYFNWHAFIFVLVHSQRFFWVAFQVWCTSFTKLFCPIWFYEWLRLFFEVCGYIVRGHVPPSISHWFFASQFLTLEKQSKGIHPIAISEVTSCLIARTIVIQFRVLSWNILILVSLI